MIVPIVFAILLGLTAIAVGLLLVSCLTDVFDGLTARAHNQVTTFGGILDGSADLLTFAAVLASLSALNIFPTWAMLMIVGGEAVLAVTALSLIVQRKDALSIQRKDIVNRTSGIISLVMVLSYMLGLHPFNAILLFMALVSLTVGFIMYLSRYARAIRARSLVGPVERTLGA